MLLKHCWCCATWYLPSLLTCDDHATARSRCACCRCCCPRTRARVLPGAPARAEMALWALLGLGAVRLATAQQIDANTAQCQASLM